MGDVVGVVAQGLGAAEDARHGVVVAGGDRIEFVIVTAGATDGHAHEAAADGVELLINDVHAQHALVLLFVVGRAKGEKGGGSELAAAFGGGLGLHEIARELLADHLAQRHIAVQ